jgi:DNA topoisomerase I
VAYTGLPIFQLTELSTVRQLREAQQLQEHGIKGQKWGEHHAASDIVPKDRKSWPKHIKDLVIPPAWTNVRISMDPKADLLAIGKDAAGRDQYVYSDKFKESTTAAKYSRIQNLEKDKPEIERQLATMSKSKDTFREAKVSDLAACARLILQTGLRPGTDADTKAKKEAFGATTLEGRHVVERGDKTYLRFAGKSGVKINLQVEDPKIAGDLRKRADIAGSSGRLFGAVDGGNIRGFVREELKGRYKTKDFRTLLANQLAVDTVSKMSVPKGEKEYKKAVKVIAERVSEKLGNTKTVALQSYINPVIFAPWRRK